MLRTGLHGCILLSVIAVFFSSSAADENRALERLMNVTAPLLEMGEDMAAEPLTGTAVQGDTTELTMTLDIGYMYHMHIWSDAFFNVFEFWLTDPAGDILSAAGGDSSLLTAYPDSTGEWTLSILLHEGASSDTASYAAAVFRNVRVLE